MTASSAGETPGTLTITGDYPTLEGARRHAAARLSASPPTARVAADELIGQLYAEQSGVLTFNQVAAIAEAAHTAATAHGASFDESIQQYRACCDSCGHGAAR